MPYIELLARACWIIPGRVAGVREGEIAHSKLVHGAQGPQTAVNGVTPLHPNQAGGLVLLEHVQDFYSAVTQNTKNDSALLFECLEIFKR